MQEKTLQKTKNRTSNIHSMDFGSVSYDIFGSPYQKSGSFLADDSLDFGYLGKPYNADTELYDYGFRDYSPATARFTTVDPIRDGRNWYCYVVNAPVNYVDLWGLECQSDEKIKESEKIMSEIKILQKEMNDWQTYGIEISSGQLSMFIELAGKYNNAIIAEGNLSLSDYVRNGKETTRFEEEQDKIGDYQVNYHSGIDIVGGDLISPFFMIAVGGSETGSNQKIFSIIGTDLRMRVLHGDANSLKKTGDFYSPGTTVMPFPEKNNFNTASTGPHFHVELSNGVNFVNPYTLEQSSKDFKTTYDGGETWVDSNFSF